jgi:hypothetical protein
MLRGLLDPSGGLLDPPHRRLNGLIWGLNWGQIDPITHMGLLDGLKDRLKLIQTKL